MKRGFVLIGLILIFTLLFFSLISASWFSDLWGKITGKAIETKIKLCIETDAGDNPYEKGITTYKKKNYIDYCFDKNRKLKEYYCDSKDKKKEKTYKCKEGCKDGACVRNETTKNCTDSDDGLNYYIAGETSGYYYGNYTTGIDVCSGDDTTLKEFYCSGNNLTAEDYSCPDGCKDGACEASFKIAEVIFRPDRVRYNSSIRIGGYFIAYLKINNTKQEELTASYTILLDNNIIDMVNLSCTNYFRYNETICVNWDYKARGFKDGNNSYIVKAIAQNTIGAIATHYQNISLNFYAPEINPALCLPLIENHNNPSANRINLVFVGQEYNEKRFSQAYPEICWWAIDQYCAHQGYGRFNYSNFTKDNISFSCTKLVNMIPVTTDNFTVPWNEINTYDANCNYIGNSFYEVFPEIARIFINNQRYGLFSVEPFKSNKNKFNFWYINRSESFVDCNYNDSRPKLLDCLPYIYLFESCNYNNRYNVQVVNKDIGGHGFILIGAPIAGGLPIYVSNDTIRGFVHEIGHSIGGLSDEYATRFWPPDRDMNDSKNCYGGPGYTKEMCLQNAPWKSMIGIEGIDCFEGCAQFSMNAFRSINKSIMGSMVSYREGDLFIFGKWNEYVIQQKLNNFSGY